MEAPPQFTVKKWNAVAVWRWTVGADSCGICRNDSHEPSLEYQITGAEDGLRAAWGSCGHMFHVDCISRWLRNRSKCPMCHQEWDFAKIETVRRLTLTRRSRCARAGFKRRSPFALRARAR